MKNVLIFIALLSFTLVLGCQTVQQDTTTTTTIPGPTTVTAVKNIKSGWSEEMVYNHSIVYPTTICFDGSNNLLVFDRAKKQILKVSSSEGISLYVDLNSISSGISGIAWQPGLGRLLIGTNDAALYTYSSGSLSLLKASGVNFQVAVAVDSSDDSFYGSLAAQGSSLVHYNAQGGMPETIATNVQGCYQIALDKTNNKLYYSETYAGKIVEVNLSDNSQTVIATGVGIPNTYEPIAVAFNGSNQLFYFTCNQGLYQYNGSSFTKVMDATTGAGQLLWDETRSVFLVAVGAGANIVGYNPSSESTSNITTYVNSFSIVEKDDGTVLITSEDTYGILEVTGSGFASLTGTLTVPCSALERDASGSIYVGSNNGKIYTLSASGTLSAWATGFNSEIVVGLAYDSTNTALAVVSGDSGNSTASIWRVLISDPTDITLVASLGSVTVNNNLPAITVDTSGNIYILERTANAIYKIASGEATVSSLITSVLDSTAITMPALEYLSKENALVVSTISTYDLWPLSTLSKTTLAENNGAVDNFAINETKEGNLIAIHSGQVFRLVH